ncbi:Acg family FMN-binding oxidoreductase [Streptomyces sp. t39]|uniref:Acg family FMN-binding oxidoreductase n=1 Tax=Streptomyces sp. t39 TaxID=1828156 RepID=UPI0011CE4D93|nr:nitroreductase family protein [Streptomyces sp. t39]TXS44752.1 nitroreductase [Streptomyces sp. t39]
MSAASASVPGPEAVSSWVADAVLAPSMHNAQPWLFRYDRTHGALTLLLDASRTMPRTDPAARGLHLGCGAALFNLRVAAAHAGWEARVHVRPAGFAPDLLAAVTFARAAAGTEQDAAGTEQEGDGLAALHPAIARRHTSRAPFTDEPVPPELLDRLREAALAEGGALDVADEWRGQTLTDLAWDAEQEEKLSPEAREEIAHWTSERARNAPEGIPTYAHGPRRQGGRALVREFPGTGEEDGADPGTAVFEWSPCLAVLGTHRDEPADWVRAGQAMERVLLRATLDGLSTSLNSQALERPGLRWLLRDPLSGAACPQMLIRLGYGPEAPATPRRPLSEVLVVD